MKRRGEKEEEMEGKKAVGKKRKRGTRKGTIVQICLELFFSYDSCITWLCIVWVCTTWKYVHDTGVHSASLHDVGMHGVDASPS